MEDCVLLPDPVKRRHTIIALGRLARVKRVETTCPALVVISSGLFLIAAAAFVSRDGNGAHLPIALLAVGFALGYVQSRRASVAFITAEETSETASGTFKQANELLRAVQNACPRLTA